MIETYQYRIGPLCECTSVNPSEIIILIDPERLEVVHVALDVPHLRDQLAVAYPATVALMGKAAAIFYETLAGRRFEDEPESARLYKALEARWALRRLKGDDPAFEFILQALEANYPPRVFDSWLGATRLDERGRIVNDEWRMVNGEWRMANGE